MTQRVRRLLNIALTALLLSAAAGIAMVSCTALKLGDPGVSLATLGASISLVLVALVVMAWRGNSS